MQIKEYTDSEKETISKVIKNHTRETIIPLRRIDYGDFLGFVYLWKNIELETIIFGKDKNFLINRTIRDLKDEKHKKIVYNYTKKELK